MTSLFGILILATAHQSTPTFVDFEVEGFARRALVYSPKVKEETERAPLVFGFHGHGGSMQNAARSFQIHELWPEAVVVYMQGLPTSGRTDPDGRRAGWQVNPESNAGRDLKFFDVVLNRMKRDFRVDDKRIYAMGHSNGGRFTYVLWTTRPDAFAAFGPSGSPATGLLSRMSPKPAFIVAGQTDQIVPFAGQKATMDALIVKSNASKEGKKSGLMTTHPSPEGNDIVTYIILGGHAYPREANKPMVEFFKTHARK